MIGQRVLPQRNLEPLHSTQRLSSEVRATIWSAHASLLALKMSFNQFSEARTLWVGEVNVILHLHDEHIGLICFSEKNKRKGMNLTCHVRHVSGGISFVTAKTRRQRAGSAVLLVFRKIASSLSWFLNYISDCDFWKLHLHLHGFSRKLWSILQKPACELFAVLGFARKFSVFSVPWAAGSAWNFFCVFHQ